MLDELGTYLGPPEDWATAISVAVADAKSLGPIRDWEFSTEVWSGWSTSELRFVLQVATLRDVIHEVVKKLSLFGYVLEPRLGSRRDLKVFCLVSPSAGFEYSFRAGLVQTELQSGL